jgi:hypothetical protein
MNRLIYILKRLAAFAVDLCFIKILIVAFEFMIKATYYYAFNSRAPFISNFDYYVLCFYFIVTEYKLGHSSFGKRIFKLRLYLQAQTTKAHLLRLLWLVLPPVLYYADDKYFGLGLFEHLMFLVWIFNLIILLINKDYRNFFDFSPGGQVLPLNTAPTPITDKSNKSLRRIIIALFIVNTLLQYILITQIEPQLEDLNQKVFSKDSGFVPVEAK